MELDRVVDFLKNAGTYYIATLEGDQPRVRPFGTAHEINGKLYIQTKKGKDVSNQLLANPNAEICAFKGGKWVRIAGKLYEDDRDEAKQAMMEVYPYVKNMYKEDITLLQVFYFDHARATFYSFGKDPEVVTF